MSASQDWAGLSRTERAMLDYARRLTGDLRSISEEGVVQLRQSGLSDLAIVEINLAVAYMNFVNRIAERLGVELEPSLSSFSR